MLAVLGVLLALVAVASALTLMALSIPATRQLDGPATGNHVVLAP